MINLKEVKKIIADTIYNDLTCTFCEDCRFDTEIADDSKCESCGFLGKNNWAISHNESKIITKKIITNILKDLFDLKDSFN